MATQARIMYSIFLYFLYRPIARTGRTSALARIILG